MNKSSLWLNLTGVICYILGVSLVATLILIPVGVYCFIAGAKYFSWANLNDMELYNQKNLLKNWAIFVSIIAFPIGLVSIIPVLKTGNNPVVTDVKPEQKSETKEGVNPEINGIKGETTNEPKAEHINQTSKEETVAKLKKFKDDGLITESEYKRAISELEKGE